MSADGGIERVLRQLGDSGLSWVDLATVESVEAHDAYGYLLNLMLQPEGVAVQARPLWLMGGAQGEGIYFPIAAGDEVVVLFPRGDRNQAVALVGPPSTPSQPPAGWANDRIELVHSGGARVALAEGATVEPVVLESLLPDMANSLTELSGLLKALGLTTPTTDQFITDLPTEYRSASLSTDKA